ncbi:uncharacterized protein [Ptychodera flava]|uniref:uncharacterized protein n=1 Tax=Ptychodera flava TaxID=63121 RepID=UPI00396AA42F
MVLRKKNEADTSRYKNPGGNDGNSDDTSSTTCDENCSSSACDSIAGDSNRRNPGSGASTTTLNSIDIDRSPQDSDAPAFGINDTIKPTSQTSLNFLGKVPYPGVLETGKAKSCTSLNDIRKHLPDDDNKYSQPSPDTPLLSSDSATVASH